MRPTLLMLIATASSALAGPYSGPTDTTNPIDGAIPASSPSFIAWADAIDESRTQFAGGGSAAVSQTEVNSLGDLGASEISSGDPAGFLTATFPAPFADTPGPDFAVFENAGLFFDDPFVFLELAYVEVSTNGSDFARFPSISSNNTFIDPFNTGQTFGGFDTTNVYNLAGKHAAGFGTPFDLSELATNPLVTSGVVDLDDIRFVRVVDIPGNGAFLDSENNPILDNWTTGGGLGGFDFLLGVGSGVGVLRAVPEPASITLVVAAFVLLARRSQR